MNNQIGPLIHTKYLQGVDKIYFIECGAVDGIHRSICKYFYDKGHRGCNFEPNKYTYVDLIKNRPHDLNINKGLSSKSGKSEFMLPKNSEGKRFEKTGCGGIEIENPEFTKSKYSVEKFEIETITFKEVIEVNNIKKVDVMILDVEGHECEVLDGFIGCDVLPKLLCIEVAKLNMNRLNKQLTKLGYEKTNDDVGWENKLYKLK